MRFCWWARARARLEWLLCRRRCTRCHGPLSDPTAMLTRCFPCFGARPRPRRVEPWRARVPREALRAA